MKIFCALLLLCAFNTAFSQQKFDVFISNSGNDSNAGKTSFAPLKSFKGSIALLRKTASEKGAVSIGLESGSHFNEALLPSYSVLVGMYNNFLYNNNPVVLNGSDEYNAGWTLVENSPNVFEHAISTAGFSGEPVGGYNYVFVVEIDKELEKTLPLTARKILAYEPSIEKVNAKPGTFYEPATISDSIQVYVHTTDGQPPNLHAKFRYEVTVRNRAVNSYDYDNNTFENLSVRGYGAGYGLLPGGYNSSYNKIIFGPGAAVHHLVLKSGKINNSLFLPGVRNIPNIALTFYNVEGFGKVNKVSNTIFLAIPQAIYSHTSYGTHYASVELNNVIGFADTAIGGQFISTSDNDTLILNNVYTDKYSAGLNVGHNNISASVISINNSCFKDVVRGMAFGSNSIKAQINNTLIRSDKKDNVTAIAMQQNTTLVLTNSILHIRNTGNQGIFLSRYLSSADGVTATGNIFIADANEQDDIQVGHYKPFDINGIVQDKLNKNVYILVKGRNMVWDINNNSTSSVTNTTSFTEWQRLSGQDLNSLFFDLRKDPRGLKAIFIDADNGNYELANTPEAHRIRAINAGMTLPVTCFLKKPSYEEAADMIRSGRLLTMNACKNPCLGTALFTTTQLNTAALNNSQVILKWTVKDNNNLDHIDVERSTGSSAFSKIYMSTVSNDSTYTFIDNDVANGISYNYRLKIVTKAGEACFSSVNNVTHLYNKYALSIFPNPSRGMIKMTTEGYSGFGTLLVLNSTGQKIVEKKITLITGIPQHVDLPKYLRGVYWLKLVLHDGVLVKRFVVE